MAVNIDVLSKSDCQELIDRIRGTLSAVKPTVLSHVSHHPAPFIRNDTHIFECLTPAVWSNGTKYYLLKPHLPTIKKILSNYNLTLIAGLSDSAINKLCQTQVIPLGIPSRVNVCTKLLWMRDNAKTFLQIQGKHGSVWHFIESYLSRTFFNHTHGCFINPSDDILLKCFSRGPFKLSGVGEPICCEFFNSIGVDEFKPDVHTISFLNRINLDRSKVKVSRRPDDVRGIGIRIAVTLGEPRKFVDSHIWVFCAEDEGKICTEDDPKCKSCWLKINEPMFCKGFPGKADIISNPVGAAKRFQECNLSMKDAYRKMEKAGLAPANIVSILTTIY